ncbi:LppU/SCO3897 family protein [Actinokineospora sp. NPDC004072]
MTDPGTNRQARKVFGLPVAVVAVLAAVVLAAAGVGVWLAVQPGGSSASGPCVAVAGPDDTAKAEQVDCDSSDATFKLASTRALGDDGCPEGAYREVRTSSELLCLMPNFVAGNCYDPDDANSAFVVADCSSAEAIRISEVIEGTVDPSGCPDGNGLGYPEPPVVFCIETPGV